MKIVDELHDALEQQNVDVLLNLTTDNFKKELEERGGLERYFRVVPKTRYPSTRKVVDVVQTRDKRIIVTDVTYLSPVPFLEKEEELITITNLIWQVREGNDWKIDKLYYISAVIEPLNLVS